MPISVEWLDETQTTSYIKFIKPWTWDDFYIGYEKAYQLTESVNHKVNVVIDFSESGGQLPPNALTHLKKLASKSHPRRGISVFVSKRLLLIKSFISILEKLTGTKASQIFAANLDEAKAIIAKVSNETSDTLPLT